MFLIDSQTQKVEAGKESYSSMFCEWNPDSSMLGEGKFLALGE